MLKTLPLDPRDAFLEVERVIQRLTTSAKKGKTYAMLTSVLSTRMHVDTVNTLLGTQRFTWMTKSVELWGIVLKA